MDLCAARFKLQLLKSQLTILALTNTHLLLFYVPACTSPSSSCSKTTAAIGRLYPKIRLAAVSTRWEAFLCCCASALRPPGVTAHSKPSTCDSTSFLDPITRSTQVTLHVGLGRLIQVFSFRCRSLWFIEFPGIAKFLVGTKGGQETILPMLSSRPLLHEVKRECVALLCAPIPGEHKAPSATSSAREKSSSTPKRAQKKKVIPYFERGRYRMYISR